MKIFLPLLSLITIFVSCEPNQRNETIPNVTPNANIPTNLPLTFSVDDSLLNNYVGSDSLFVYDGMVIYVGRNNNIDFALVQINDTTTLQYQRTNSRWIILDTFYYPLLLVSPTDLNGDNYDDLVITYYITGAGGNAENICLLYNPVAKQLYHNDHFDLPNIQFNKKSNTVFSSWWAGATHGQEKVAYTITGDSLTFKEGVHYEPDEISQGEMGTVEFYKMQGQDKIVLKRIRGKSGKVFDIFEKALWDSGMD